MRKVKEPQPIIKDFIPINLPYKSSVFEESLTKKSAEANALILVKSPPLFISKLRENPNLIFTDSVVQFALRLLQGACLIPTLEKNAKRILTKAGLPLFIPQQRRERGRPRKKGEVTINEYNKIKKHLVNNGLHNDDRKEIHELIKAYFQGKNQRPEILENLSDKLEKRIRYLRSALEPLQINLQSAK